MISIFFITHNFISHTTFHVKKTSSTSSSFVFLSHTITVKSKQAFSTSLRCRHSIENEYDSTFVRYLCHVNLASIQFFFSIDSRVQIDECNETFERNEIFERNEVF